MNTPPPHTHTLLTIWSRPQLTLISLFCCSVTQERQSLSQTTEGQVHNKYMPPILFPICDKLDIIKQVVKWTYLLDRRNTKRGRTVTDLKQQKGNQCGSLLVFSFTLLSLFIFQPQSTEWAAFSTQVFHFSQGHWKTQYSYLRQSLVRIISKCLQDIKSWGKLPFRVMIYSLIETDSRTFLHIFH